MNINGLHDELKEKYSQHTRLSETSARELGEAALTWADFFTLQIVEGLREDVQTDLERNFETYTHTSRPGQPEALGFELTAKTFEMHGFKVEIGGCPDDIDRNHEDLYSDIVDHGSASLKVSY